MLGYTTLWFIINRNTYFRLSSVFWHHISQGSVATYLRCGGIFKHDFIAYIPLSLLAKKLVNIWGSYGQEFGVLFFLTHGVVDMISTRKEREREEGEGKGKWREEAVRREGREGAKWICGTNVKLLHTRLRIPPVAAVLKTLQDIIGQTCNPRRMSTMPTPPCPLMEQFSPLGNIAAPVCLLYHALCPGLSGL